MNHIKASEPAGRRPTAWRALNDCDDSLRPIAKPHNGRARSRPPAGLDRECAKRPPAARSGGAAGESRSAASIERRIN